MRISLQFLRIPRIFRAARSALPILVIASIAGSLLWGGCRFVNSGSAFPRVPAGFVGILLRKDGRPLPHGQVVAPRVAPDELPYQGVQQDVLLPGWYPTDYRPWKWEWRYLPQTVVPPNHVGVVTRCFGEDLPENQVFADENPEDEQRGILRRGPLRKTLEPGSHPLNLYAYDVRIFPVRSVEAGQVGVLCKRYGPMPKDPAAFLSEPGERGVQKQGLTSGTYLINPLAEELRIVSRQSNRLDLGLSGRVRFPSSDGFDISLTGTIEWSLVDSQIPLIFVRFGDTDQTEKKLILPSARAKSRIQGSRKPAREFISGGTRQSFQDEFAKDMKSTVETEGIKVHSVLISGIVPPDEIAKPIRDREVSLLEQEQYKKEMSTERGRADLERQIELQKRPAILAGAVSKSIERTSQAKRVQELELIKARGELDVAKLERSAADAESRSITSRGEAEASVARMQIETDSEALRQRIEASGGGSAFVRSALFERIATKLGAISLTPESRFLAELQRWAMSPLINKHSEDEGKLSIHSEVR